MAEMSLVDTAARRTAVVRGRVRLADLPAFLGRAFATVAESVERQGAHVTGPPVTFYRSIDDDGCQIEAGFPVATDVTADGAVVPSRLPGGRTVEAVHVGPYTTLPRTYAEMDTWIREHGLRAVPGMWEAYLSEPDEAAPTTLVVQPVEDAPLP